MKIELQFFAPLSLVIGMETTVIELPGHATGADLICHLRARFFVNQPNRINVMLLVNQQYVNQDTTLKDGDSVTVIPMQSCCH